MKLRFLSTGPAPTHYEIDDETINDFDLSALEHGDKWQGNDETEAAGIRHAERDEAGELWVTLKQEVGPGHWSESEWIDAADYDPDAVYVKQKEGDYSGRAYAVTRKGKVYV